MNPLLLLLGLLGMGAMGGSGRSDTTSVDAQVPDTDTSDDQDPPDTNTGNDDDDGDAGSGNTGGNNNSDTPANETPVSATITLVVYDENGYLSNDIGRHTIWFAVRYAEPDREVKGASTSHFALDPDLPIHQFTQT